MSRKKMNYQATEYWCYADPKSFRNPPIPLGVSIGLIPPSPPNPFSANGGVTGCGAGAIITVWLTDGEGNQIFGTGTLKQVGGSWTWTADFPPPALPGGEYTFTVQVQFGNQTANVSTDVDLPDPPSKGLRKRRVRHKVASKMSGNSNESQ